MVIELTECCLQNKNVNVLEMLEKAIVNKTEKPSKIVHIEVICKKVNEDISHDSVMSFLDFINNHFYCTNKSYKFDFKIKDSKSYQIRISADMELDNNYILKNFKIIPNCLYKFKIELQ